MEIEFDPIKARSNLAKHKLSFAHAEQALRDPMAVTVEDPDAEGELRFVTLGVDAPGRVLVVVHSLARRSGPVDLGAKGQQRRIEAIPPCVRNTISARASGVL